MIWIEFFQGDTTIKKQPKIIVDGYYKDFGYGFYCTSLEKQAKRWALVKPRGHVVNIYEYVENHLLNTLVFNEVSDEWLDFVVSCRRGIKHDYDCVEGPMADDTIYNYIQNYIDGKISRAAFWELAKFNHPTHQISFHTVSALSTLRYVGNEVVYGG